MKLGYWNGKKRPEETKRKISETQKGKKSNPKCILAMAKKNKENGKGRQSYNYSEWRRKVLERDGSKCVKCQKQHEKMHCHHIVPWKDNKELRFSMENGETLCASCHMRIGKENKEINGDLTQFKKGQISPRKGIKTGKPSWNSGKKGLPSSWNKGKKWSEEVKQKISQSRKGKGLGNQYAKGNIAWNKGIPNTEEMNRKNREAHLGKRHSIATEFKKGFIPWNKDKKGLQVALNKYEKS